MKRIKIYIDDGLSSSQNIWAICWHLISRRRGDALATWVTKDQPYTLLLKRNFLALVRGATLSRTLRITEKTIGTYLLAFAILCSTSFSIAKYFFIRSLSALNPQLSACMFSFGTSDAAKHRLTPNVMAFVRVSTRRNLLCGANCAHDPPKSWRNPGYPGGDVFKFWSFWMVFQSVCWFIECNSIYCFGDENFFFLRVRGISFFPRNMAFALDHSESLPRKICGPHDYAHSDVVGFGSTISREDLRVRMSAFRSNQQRLDHRFLNLLDQKIAWRD